ncbi:MAG: energy transducer TonB, partial [Leptospira sp.]|nr:energy transducer TonB [Leptospira sp.]
LSGFKKSRTVSMPGSSGDPGEVYSYKKNVSEDYKSVTSKKTKEQNLNEISVGSRKTEGKLYFLPGSAKRDIVSDPVLHYPPGIKNSGISAVVKIKAKIDQEGRVYAVQFLEKSGFSSLDLSVSRQIRSMRFSNVSMDIPSEFIREYHFKLKSN